ncbi:MAG TPA: YebC/PmpR family DNA-binding transcriptional regulator [Candidatus Omnitrophica bacterium]|nr:YebC/PmpR family DNA-binding transcriptional regulator [Candidatus Omnitrophota bacterium]
MAGHNKWSKIKHAKAITDAKKGKAFTKVTREIMVAAKEGGGDPGSNFRLRSAIQAGKDVNMPTENIERAIKKGTGDIEGVNYESITYEGYGPQGVAILVACLTDNKNRAAQDVRTIFTKNNGSPASAGSVSFMFEKKGYFFVLKSVSTEDKLMELALNAGAEDFAVTEEGFEIKTAPSDFGAIQHALETAGIKPEVKELTMIPKNMVAVLPENAKAVMELIEALEENDDVQNVYSNAEIPDEVLKNL